jgi:hypothetical protein
MDGQRRRRNLATPSVGKRDLINPEDRVRPREHAGMTDMPEVLGRVILR